MTAKKARQQNLESVTKTVLELLDRGVSDSLETVKEGTLKSLTSTEVDVLLQDPRVKAAVVDAVMRIAAHVTA